MQHARRITRRIPHDMAIYRIRGIARDTRHAARRGIQAGIMGGIVINHAGPVSHHRIQHEPRQVCIAKIARSPTPAHDQRAVILGSMCGQCGLQTFNRCGIAQPSGLDHVGATIHQMHMRILKSRQNKPAASVYNLRPRTHAGSDLIRRPQHDNAPIPD